MKKRILSLIVLLIMVSTFLSSCIHIFHNHEYSQTLVEATCTSKGVDLYACKDCGHTKVKNTPKLDHNYGDWIIDKKPTENETGLKHLECIICGYKTKSETIPKQTEKAYKLGMGIVVNMEENIFGYPQVNAVIASVVLDGDGRIVLCYIDAIQNKMNTVDGEVDATQTFMTKRELGDNYGLHYGPDLNNDGIVKEWYEQATIFESYVIGKTAKEVENIATQVVENGYIIATDESLLSAGCTINIIDFKSAVVKACNDDQGMSFMATPGTFTLGAAVNTSASESTSATEYSEGRVYMYSDFACAVVGADGKILATLNDGIQPRFHINIYGEITSKNYSATKRELMESYGMSTFGLSFDQNGDGIVLEWYLQSAAFSKRVTGMTASQVANMTTSANSIGYQMTTDSALLNAGCTIDITTLKAIVAKAANNAR